MQKDLEFETLKFIDWSKHRSLTESQLKKLIQEKVLRAKIQSKAMKKLQKTNS